MSTHILNGRLHKNLQSLECFQPAGGWKIIDNQRDEATISDQKIENGKKELRFSHFTSLAHQARFEVLF